MASRHLLLHCPLCGSPVGFHSDLDPGCNGCHFINCTGCRAVFDLGETVDPANVIETLDEFQDRVAEAWNLREMNYARLQTH